MKNLLSVSTLLFILAGTSPGWAAILEWDRNSEVDMDHYNIYTCPTAGCTVVKGVNKSSVVVLQTTAGVRPTTDAVSIGKGFAAVTAVDSAGNESDLSNQAGFPIIIDSTPPANPTGLTAR